LDLPVLRTFPELVARTAPVIGFGKGECDPRSPPLDKISKKKSEECYLV